MGVIERGENLALVPEPADDQLGVHPAPDHLHGDAPLELVIGAAGEIDGPHPAVTDASIDTVRPERAADIGFRVFEGVLDDAKLDERGLVDEGAGRGVGAEERLDFLAQLPSLAQASSRIADRASGHASRAAVSTSLTRRQSPPFIDPAIIRPNPTLAGC